MRFVPVIPTTSHALTSNRHLEPNALRKHIYHGSRRGINYDTLQKYDLLITTYGTIRSEMASSDSESILKRMFFFRIILDEGKI